MPDFLDWIYRGLFRPCEAYEEIRMAPTTTKEALIVLAAVLVAVISAIGVVNLNFINGLDGLVSWMFIGALVGLAVWLVTSAVYASAAFLFGVKQQTLTLFILTAFSLLPWLLLPVVLSFKHSLEGIGAFIGGVGLIGIWVWSTVLFVKALKYTYHITFTQAFFAASIPLLMTVVGGLWSVSLFWNFVQLLN